MSLSNVWLVLGSILTLHGVCEGTSASDHAYGHISAMVQPMQTAEWTDEVQGQFRVTDRDILRALTEDHAAIMELYDTFLNELNQSFPNEVSEIDIRTIVDAITFAAHAHKDQKRKCPAQEPYIIHPIGVARSLWIEGRVRNINVLIAAILHDTVEDTEATLKDIEDMFGAKVAAIVAEVTDDKSLPQAERKRLQIVNAPHKSPEAKLVKLADKLYNLRDIMNAPPVGWSQERSHNYFLWAEKVVSGLRGVNPALEAALDQVFRDYLQKIAFLPDDSSLISG